MNMSKNLLKSFAAVAMLCVVGAVFATPVALGDGIIKDANVGAALMYYGAYSKNVRYTTYGSDIVKVGMMIPTVPGIWQVLAVKVGTIA
ncbi:hypothetical protein [Methanothermococcus sp.]|uniref:hypothetical protein n=1 Tax=Methanothermococcus sp. TaxID=2614238 RepID=UPI0025CDCA09|nr:hypothetical protein [Methanothermococcus sp.]